VAAERAFLRKVGGGCHAPIAALAEVTGDRLTLRGLVGDLRGARILRDRVEGPMTEPEIIGARLAERLLRKGAGDLLSHPSTPAPGGND
jgi:hydroxymethylbilane synthase